MCKVIKCFLKNFVNKEKTHIFASAIPNGTFNGQRLKVTSQVLLTPKHSTSRPDGGIGRRVGLKHQYLTMCRFEPGSGYKAKWYDRFVIPLFRYIQHLYHTNDHETDFVTASRQSFRHKISTFCQRHVFVMTML